MRSKAPLKHSRSLYSREQRLSTSYRSRTPSRSFWYATPLLSTEKDRTQQDASAKEVEQGAMSRRLSEMAEETMDTGSKSDRKMMKDVGFSEELKKRLEERIAQTSFNAENQKALSETSMPSFAGKGTRDQAAAQAWSGTESVHDSALRMLDDSHKRLRPPSRTPHIAPKVNLRPAPKKNISAADRLAQARDKTSIYAFSQQNELSEEEREKFRKELKERFTPGARPMPTTLQGLASLANERIEDAIARGQFKNIPRGKGKNVERDYNANSPFLDTTEYFMNKIIQKQEIVPPWIEKQQELVKTVTTFRSRLRNDWRRHVARTISSKGGSVEEQVRRAQAYAIAEEKENPPQARVARFSEIDSAGNLSTVTVEERIASGLGPQEAVGTNVIAPTTTIRVTEAPAEEAPTVSTLPPSADSPTSAEPTSSSATLPISPPFRDPNYLSIESAYHNLAIAEINSLTRSYNLMAPKIAQKPYYTLQRELKKCYADVAPQVADEILQRAQRGKIKVEIMGNESVDGVLSVFSVGGVDNGHIAKVRDEDLGRKGYGFKEFWRDLFRKEEAKERAKA